MKSLFRCSFLRVFFFVMFEISDQAVPASLSFFRLNNSQRVCSDVCACDDRSSMSAFSKYEILVVDNDPGVREVMEQLLVSEGYGVTTAEDGFKALLELIKRTPDVILSDLVMPRISGTELFSIVQRHFPDIVTVVMSGSCGDGALPPGVFADGLFAKGANPKELLATLAQLLCAAPPRNCIHSPKIIPTCVLLNGNDWRELL